METGIEFAWVFQSLKKHWWKILLTGLLLAVVAFVYVKKTVHPTFTSDTALMVNIEASGKDDSQLTVQQAEVQKIDTYKDIVESPSIMKEVAYNLTHKHRETTIPGKKAVYGTYKNSVTGEITKYLKEKKQSPKYRVVSAKYGKGAVTTDQVSSAVSISSNANSQVFKIKATSSDSVLSKNIANATAAVFRERVQTMMSGSRVTIVSRANDGSIKTGSTKKYVLVGLIMGVILGAFVVLLYGFYKELTDKRIDNDSFLTDELGFTKLGAIHKK